MPSHRLERLLKLREAVEREIAREIRTNIPPRRFKALRVAECGTDAGYYRHRRTLKEASCEACKAAHRIAENARSARRRAA